MSRGEGETISRRDPIRGQMSRRPPQCRILHTQPRLHLHQWAGGIENVDVYERRRRVFRLKMLQR